MPVVEVGFALDSGYRRPPPVSRSRQQTTGVLVTSLVIVSVGAMYGDWLFRSSTWRPWKTSNKNIRSAVPLSLRSRIMTAEGQRKEEAAAPAERRLSLSSEEIAVCQ